MARIFRHTYTAKDKQGNRVQRKTRKWYIEYRDCDGVIHREAGYRDRKATEQKATECERQAERRQSGMIDGFAEHRKRPLTEHVVDYEAHLISKRACPQHRVQALKRLRACLTACGFAYLQDISTTPVEKYLNLLVEEGKSLRTRNTYLESIRAFCNWCVKAMRLPANPLAMLSMANTQPDIRRKRRALTEVELQHLITVARNRPVDAACTILKGNRKGQKAAKLKPGYRSWLERCGHERALEYKTMVLTGLRKGELTGLEWRDLEIEANQSWVTVRAETAKNNKTEKLPVRDDLAEDLRAWRAIRGTVRPSDKVFHVPRNLVRQLRKDLKAAGIPDRDGAGRVVDVHALRHTTSSHGAKAGVAPRTLQALMRHSDIRLTMGAYTDPALLDQRAAVEALPRISLEASPERRHPTNGSVPDATVKPTAPTITLHESWRDFLAFFLVSDLVEQGSSIKPELTSDDTGATETHNDTHDVKSERAATYGRSCHSLAAVAADYPQGDLNPC